MVLVAGFCGAMLGAGGCAVRVQGRRRPLVRTEGIRGDLRLTVEQRTNEASSSSGAPQKYEHSFMTEELNVQTKGDIFNRKLLEYVLGAGFGLRQQEFDNGTDSARLSGEMSRYNVMMNLLSSKPYPTNLNLSKSENMMERQFNSPLRVVSTTEGLHTRLRVPGWPMRISWENEEMEQKLDFRGSAGGFTRTTERFSYDVEHDFSERSHLRFTSNLSKLKSKSNSNSYQSKTARHNLRHDYSFGSDDQHDLDTRLTYMERDGRSKSEIFNWMENLSLHHSENFSTFYNSSFIESKFAEVKSNAMRGSAGFMHRLYDNFRTNASLNASKTESSFGTESTSYGGNLGFNYSKGNRWGRLRSRYSTSLTMREINAQTGTEAVVGESHTFDDPVPIELDRRNVVISSIVVTNNAGDEIYSEDDGSGNGDYTIRVVGDRVELDIHPLDGDEPDIVDGQIILVDYLVSVDGSWEEEYFRQSFYIGQAFKNGVSIFYDYSSSNSEINNDSTASVLGSEFESNRVGIAYYGKRISLRAEHAETESTFNSTESDMLSASVNYPLSPRTLLDCHASQTWMETSGLQSRDTSLFRAGAGVRSRLTRYLRLDADVGLRKEDSSDRGQTNGLEFDIGLEYNRRQLSVRTGWQTYYLDYNDREREGSTFYLRLIRRF